MTPDDTPIPEDDAIARAARARPRPARRRRRHRTPLSWSDVQAGARGFAAGGSPRWRATCAVVVARRGHGGRRRPRRRRTRASTWRAGRRPPTTSTPASTSTTQPTTVTTGPPATTPGAHTTVPPSLPNLSFLTGDAPQAGDVSGTITITSGNVTAQQQTIEVGRPVDVTASILNVTSHRIVPSCVCKPTSLRDDLHRAVTRQPVAVVDDQQPDGSGRHRRSRRRRSPRPTTYLGSVTLRARRRHDRWQGNGVRHERGRRRGDRDNRRAGAPRSRGLPCRSYPRGGS